MASRWRHLRARCCATQPEDSHAARLPWFLLPLHHAARLGDSAGVRAALASGASLNGRDAVGSTALMHAAEQQHGAALTALLQAGADVEATNDWGWDVALYATTGRRADALLPLLLSAGVPADAASVVPRERIGGAHGRLLRRARAPDALPSEALFGLRGLLASAATSADDVVRCPADVRAGGVAIAGATCERLGLYAGQRYAVRALFWRPAGVAYVEGEARVEAPVLTAAPPPAAAGVAAWELCAELASPRWMPGGSTEVSVGAAAAALRDVRSELSGALAVALGMAAALLVALPTLSSVTFAYVPSDSMAPTLLRGDAVVAALRPEHVAVGDVVLFDPPPRLAALIAAAGAPPLRPGDLFIKRVVGIAGDTVSARAGILTRNGAPGLAPPPDGPSCAPCKAAAYDWAPLTLAPGELAVLGDNRGGSTDSHAWGALDARRVVGRVVWRWWPPERFGAVS